MQVLVADDIASVRFALRLLLEEEPGVELAGEAADAAEAVQLAEALFPDVVLLDWELPGMPIETLLELLRQNQPRLRIIALSSRPEAWYAAQAANVTAFVSKGSSAVWLRRTLRAVMDQGEDNVNAQTVGYSASADDGDAAPDEL